MINFFVRCLVTDVAKTAVEIDACLNLRGRSVTTSIGFTCPAVKLVGSCLVWVVLVVAARIDLVLFRICFAPRLHLLDDLRAMCSAVLAIFFFLVRDVVSAPLLGSRAIPFLVGGVVCFPLLFLIFPVIGVVFLTGRYLFIAIGPVMIKILLLLLLWILRNPLTCAGCRTKATVRIQTVLLLTVLREIVDNFCLVASTTVFSFGHDQDECENLLTLR